MESGKTSGHEEAIIVKLNILIRTRVIGVNEVVFSFVKIVGLFSKTFIDPTSSTDLALSFHIYFPVLSLLVKHL